MSVFVDSSALVKRYIRESGSDEVMDLFKEKYNFIVSIVALPEIISALSRRLRDGDISKRQFNIIKQHVQEDYQVFGVVNLQNTVLAATVNILEKFNVRTLDAIHLASACEAKPEIFVSADHRQILAGKKLGLKIREV